MRAACLTNLGSLALGLEAPREALEHSRAALKVAQGIDDRRAVAIAQENLALAQAALRRGAEARAALAEARTLARGIGDAERLVSLDLAEAEIDLALKQRPAEALARVPALRRGARKGRLRRRAAAAGADRAARAAADGRTARRRAPGSPRRAPCAASRGTGWRKRVRALEKQIGPSRPRRTGREEREG